MTEHASVVEAVAAITSEIGAVEKTRKKGAQVTYAFRGIDDVINAVNPLLGKHGVVIVPRLESADYVEAIGYGKGGWTRTRVLVHYDIHGPNGSTISGAIAAEALDNGDKGPGKAMSYAYKTFVSQLFAIPTDDPELDNEHRATPEYDQPPVVDTSALADKIRNAFDTLEAEKQSKLDTWLTTIGPDHDPLMPNGIGDVGKHLAPALLQKIDAQVEKARAA